jgi:CheY-like chemotaxis protein
MSIINDIIDISLIETGQVVIKKQSFDLQEVFKDLEFTYQFKHKGNGVKIEYENNKNEKITFFGDSTRIYQVFVNLLNNALKFTEEGSVKFGFKQKESEIEFYVKDTGIGIEEEDKDKVFKYFHKINPETKIEHGGLGIGLTISKHIVELMGGEMYLESEYGKGTTFYFSLPKEQHLANDIENNKKEIIINKESLPSLVDYKILIAEDDELNYKYYEVLFSKLDTTIVWFKNGLELVDYIKANIDIDKCIILMDIKMPVMDGVEAMQEVKKIRKDIPIIASTAHSLSTDKDNYIGMGFDDYMSKPINRERLVGVISAWV